MTNDYQKKKNLSTKENNLSLIIEQLNKTKAKMELRKQWTKMQI